jgi:hypothetical protein
MPGRIRFLLVALVALIGASPATSHGFSVLAHQAVVDRSWDATLAPALQRRFPGGDPVRARSFAYGGSHVADLGYFPFGSKLFTELLHYVRTGDFVANLLAAARDADEYAFALGALAHYVADPKLGKKFGERVTYADDAASHLQTEFRFDVFQMARTRGSHDLFHHALQFEVATRVLDAAMAQTYGLRLGDLFASPEVAILTYRYAFRGLIHEATGIAWEIYRADIQALDPQATPAGFVYDLSREDFETEFGKVAAEPGYFAKAFAWLTMLVPNVGPFKRTVFKPLPPAAREQYAAALDHAVARYRAMVASLGSRGAVDLPAQNLDTATPTRFGDYSPADEAYAGLVAALAAKADGTAAPSALRADLRRFYAGRPLGVGRDDDERELDAALVRVAGDLTASRPVK